MALFDRISRVIRANVNDLVGKAEDPEKNPGTSSYRYARRLVQCAKQ